MRIYFEHLLRIDRAGSTNVDHDPILRDWPAVPAVGDRVSFDLGEPEPAEGQVVSVLWTDDERATYRPAVTVRFQ